MIPVILCVGACDQRVVNFGGAQVVMTLRGLPETPLSEHIEIWARDGEQGIVRLNPENDVAYTIVPALSLTDACAIDEHGHLVWKPDGQHECFGRPCADANEQMLAAESVKRRIQNLVEFQSPLLALVPWEDATRSRPAFDENLPADQRLAACESFWTRSPNAYSGNPRQLTAPIHGTLFGTLDFFSATEVGQIAGGISFTTRFALRDLREIWIAQTPAQVTRVDASQIDCDLEPSTCRGRTLLQGNRGALGRDTLRFELRPPPDRTGSGVVTVYTQLDRDPVQF